MSDKKKTSEADRAAIIGWRRVRWRFIGAGVLLLAAFVLWRLGDSPSLETLKFAEVTTPAYEFEEPPPRPETPKLESFAPAVIDEPPPIDTPALTAPVEVVVEAEKAEPVAEPEPSANDTPPPTATSDWVVQVGAFSEQERAETMATRLQADDFAATIEETERNGAAIWRVRVTGFEEQAAAEETRLRLLKLGYEGAILIDLR